MTFEILLIASLVIAGSYWLEENTLWTLHISSVVLIIILASILGNSAIIPSSSDTYNDFFRWSVPLGIALMLMAFNPKNLLRIKKEFLICFAVGAIGTIIGGIVAGLLFAKIIPEHYWQASGQLIASFIGGYENAVAVGTALGLPAHVFVPIFAGDSVITTLWIVFNIFQGRKFIGNTSVTKNNDEADKLLSGSTDVSSLAIAISATFCIVFFADYLALMLPNIFGSKIMLVSLLATLVTFTPLRHRLSGAYVLGSVVLSYFFFACGAISNVVVLFKSATMLVFFPVTVLFFHAIIIFGFAKIFKIKKDIAITASQALIGGPATALTVVIARKWDYGFETIALGLLGYTIANYIGISTAWILKAL
ncbi:MAG: DUF819 family protein [Ottowia sp.]|nr:DUF819 family protein [Ottowia sp.]